MVIVKSSSAAPLVSLGLPVYNGGHLLAKALDSALGQTYGDFELLVSDNASTDDTPDIVREYAARDSRIRYVRHPKNIGSGNNWTFVGQQARGTWHLWISHNDVYGKTLLEDCLKPLQADPSVAVCYGRTQLIDKSGQPLELYDGDFDLLDDDPITRYCKMRKLLHLGTPIQAGVIRLDALRRARFLRNYGDSDRVLISGLALSGKFVLLPQVLLYRCWDPSAASGLRTPLQVHRLYHPNATRAPYFHTLPRQLGQLHVAATVPERWPTKLHAVWAALKCTDWKRKLTKTVPEHPLYRGQPPSSRGPAVSEVAGTPQL